MQALLARKDALIADFAGYRRRQLEDGRFQLLRGAARFEDAHTLHVEGHGPLTAGRFVVATGSVMAPPPIPDLAALGCLDSDAALRLDRVPASLVVLGGGPVALEFAQYFARLGSRVTVIQRGPHLLSAMDADLGEELARALEREGIRVLTGTRLTGADGSPGLRRVRFERAGIAEAVEAEAVFNGLGRRPATSGLGLERAGVRLRASGHVECDATQRTSAPHIYAAGDCCGPLEVVHVAIQQAEVAARNLLSGDGREEMDDRCRLVGVFTEPGVAVAGMGEREAQRQGRQVKVARYPFNDHGKSMILGCQEGFVKLVADAGSGELLGGACVGPQACELIHEVVVALAARMTAAQLARVPHYHPTLSEIWTYPAEDLG
jgi:pyruvate/2-oxoglutarate dehydrogenase complex dihydrolipoamide dehydrogenase (E3) component